MLPNEIIEALDEYTLKAKNLGDRLKDLSNEANDVDVVSLIMSLSMSCYDVAVDIQDAIDTFRDILEEKAEELELNDIDEEEPIEDIE